MIINPVLQGFCPDPSIIRTGDEYYIATSTFHWWPGVRLWHSRDLVHWQQIESPLQHQLSLVGEQGHCGVWAPDLSYSDGVFYLVYTDTKARNLPLFTTHNYLVTAKSIHGPWSEPVYLNSSGFDPSLFHSPDGKKYLINMRNGFKGILLQEFSVTEQKLIGPIHTISKGSGLPYTEGPHLYYKEGMYYLMLAEGGTSYQHCVTIQRSSRLLGPYETDPLNPMLTSRDIPFSPLQRSGHGSLVETQHGQWYLAHLCSRPIEGTRLSPMGRETALQEVYWDEQGWLRLRHGSNHPASRLDGPLGLPVTLLEQEKPCDDFTCLEKLPVWYACLRTKADYSCEGNLRLYGQEDLSSLFHVSLVARRRTSFSSEATTAMRFFPTSTDTTAGLAYYYDEKNYIALGKSMDEQHTTILSLLTVVQGHRSVVSMPLHNCGTLILSIKLSGVIAQCFVGDGKDRLPVFDAQDASMATDEATCGFTGSLFALYCVDTSGRRNHADFDFFAIHP